MSNTASSWSTSKTRRLVFLAIWSAIIVVMAVTPYVGYFPFPFLPVTLTLLQIPVIVGAIMLGPVDGAFLGLVFGITSMIQAPFLQAPTAFLFNPFVTGGSYKSAIIALVPRILIGVVAAYVFRLVKKIDKTEAFAALAAAVIGTLTNSVLVLGGFFVFFKDKLASGKTAQFFFKVLVGIFVSNSLLEIAATALVVTAVWMALSVIIRRSSLRKV
jgi:uncharacterized membrane protein